MINILKTLVIGRPNGFRRSLLKRFVSESEDTSPSSSFASPMGTHDDVASNPTTSVKEAPKDVTPPEGFEVVLHVDALSDGDIKEIIIAGTAIAVVQAKGEVYAFSNTFSHDVGTGGPLTEGTLLIDDDSCLIRSPYLGWDFDIKAGTCLTSPQIKLECFETTIVESAICVKV